MIFGRIIISNYYLYGLLVLSVCLTVIITFFSLGFPNFFYEDDSYYYVTIARNISLYGRSSFDGINITNGYHPLWAIILSGIHWIISLVTNSRLVFIGCVTFLSISSVLYVSLYVNTHKQLGLLFVLMSLYSSVIMPSTILALVIIFLFIWWSGKKISKRFYLLCICVPLLRIDTFYFPLLIIVSDYFFLKTISKHKAIIILVCTSTGMILNFLYQFALTGEFYNVASYIKFINASERGVIEFLVNNISSSGNIIRYCVLLIVLSLIFVSAYKNKNVQHLTMLFGVIIFVLIHSSFNYMRDWYFAIPLLVSIFVCAQDVISQNKVIKSLSLVLSGIVVIPMAMYLYLHKEDMWNTYQFVHETNEIVTSPDSRAFQIDGSGFTAYWLNFPVINGDGLANSIEYAKRLGDNNLQTYIDDFSITHLITNSVKNKKGFVKDYHGLELHENDLKLIVETKSGRNALSQFRIFKILKETFKGID